MNLLQAPSIHMPPCQRNTPKWGTLPTRLFAESLLGLGLLLSHTYTLYTDACLHLMYNYIHMYMCTTPTGRPTEREREGEANNGRPLPPKTTPCRASAVYLRGGGSHEDGALELGVEPAGFGFRGLHASRKGQRQSNNERKQETNKETSKQGRKETKKEKKTKTRRSRRSRRRRKKKSRWRTRREEQNHGNMKIPVQTIPTAGGALRESWLGWGLRIICFQVARLGL